MSTLLDLPVPVTLPGFHWKFAQPTDLPAVHQMLVEADEVNHTTTAGTLEDFQRVYNDPWCNPTTDFLLGETYERKVVSIARVFVNPQPESEYMAYLFGEVHPAYRGLGLGASILSWMEDRGCQRLSAFASDKPHVLRTGCPDNLEDRIQLFELHDFVPVRYFYRMRRDLRLPIPSELVPDGMQLHAFQPEQSEAVLAAFNDSFSDQWGFEPVTPEDWRMFYLDSKDFRPDLTFLLRDGEEIAGMILSFVHGAQNERQGFQEGWIQDLGARRAWRERGVFPLLLCKAMQAFHEQGLEYATLGIDTEDPTGELLDLYEHLGFIAVKRYITFEKPLEGWCL